MVDIAVKVDTHGPIFDRRIRRIIDDFLDDAKDAVAQQGLADVHQLLDESIRNPTPYYETQITKERVADDVVVHDRGIVYGPWLEGTGSRNATTRFKGYSSFRRAAQALQRKVPAIVERVLIHHLPRMN